MRKLIIITILCLLSVFAKSQVYQLMPQYGYDAKRMNFDSTISIPTFCGNPSLLSNKTKKAAIAFDSCNNRFYYYNPKTLVWDTIRSGTPVDTTKFVRYTDTASFLNPYLRKIDTTNKWITNVYRKTASDSVFYIKGGASTFAFKDSAGGVQSGRFGNDTATIVMIKVHNDAGTTLTNGEVVYLATSGTNADAPSVKRARNTGDATSANTFGFVLGSINNNDTGYIIISGKIEKLNTSGYSNGTIIYLDSIAGKWTSTKPKAPYHLVYLGAVVKSNAGNGTICVKPQNGYELDEIHDVQIITPLNNQIVVYSDTQSIWKNRSLTSVLIVKENYTSGASVTMAGTWLIVNPASLVSTLTINLPTAPTDGQEASISFGGTLTTGIVVNTLTISPTPLQSTTPRYIEVGENISYRWNATNSKWYRIN